MADSIGNVYAQQATPSDNGTPVVPLIATFEWDGGDQRAQQNYGDGYLDCNPASAITVTPTSLGAPAAAATVIPATGGARTFATISMGGQITQKYVGLVITWKDSTAVTVLNLWQLSIIPQPVTETNRIHDWEGNGARYYRGFWLTADTGNLPKNLIIRDGDSGQAKPYIGILTNQIQHNGQQQQGYAFPVPFVGHLVRREGNDNVPWRYWDTEWVADAWPELTDEDSPWIKLFQDGGAAYFQGFVAPIVSGGVLPNLSVRTDAGELIQLDCILSPAANVKTSIPFSLVTPVVCHEVQIIKNAPCRVWYPEIQWQAQRTPEVASTWMTQFTAMGLTGYLTIPQVEFSWVAPEPITISITAYGGTSPNSISLNAGGPQKRLFVMTPNKGKTFQFAATSAAPFQLFLNDSVVWVAQWGRPGRYVPYRLLGGVFGDQANI
jgi:hypothetical protein